MNGPIIAYRANLGVQTSAPFANTYSLDYDGVDDFVSTSASTSGNITLSAWINCNGTYASWQPKYPLSILTSHAGLSNATLGRLYKLGANLHVMIQVFDNNGANFNNYYVPIILEGIGYKHCVWTFDNTTKIINFYLDGVVQTWTKWGGVPSGIPYLTAPGYSYNSNLTIGRISPSTSSGTFMGLVDEVSLFDKILTQAEITSISAAPSDLTSLSPIAWYRNGDNGSWKSPQWLIPNNENKDKVSNYSFEFDGVDDVIPIRTISQTVGTGNITYSSWIKTSKVGVYGQYRCAFGGYSNGGATYTINKLGTPFGTTDLVLWYGSSSIVLNDGNWHNIITTFDVTTKQQLSYVDGVLDRTYTAPSWITHFGICIGAGKVGQYNFEGDVSDCAVFNRVLTQLEATSIYNSGTPNDITPLTPSGYWKMGEEATFSTNWTVPDAAGSNDGTSANMTIEDRIGEAPNSTSNALSYNMDEVDRVEDTP